MLPNATLEMFEQYLFIVLRSAREFFTHGISLPNTEADPEILEGRHARKKRGKVPEKAKNLYPFLGLKSRSLPALLHIFWGKGGLLIRQYQ